MFEKSYLICFINPFMYLSTGMAVIIWYLDYVGSHFEVDTYVRYDMGPTSPLWH